MVTLQVAISPVGQSTPLFKTDCTDSPAIPAISPASMHNMQYRFQSNEQSLSAKRLNSVRTLQVIPISLSRESRVRAVVESNFLYGPLLFVMQRGRVSSGGAIGVWANNLWVCTPSLDGCELDVVVPGADYALKLWQPMAGREETVCLKYKVSVTVVPKGHAVDQECGGGSLMPSMLKNIGGVTVWSAQKLIMPTAKDDDERKNSIQVIARVLFF